MKKTFGATIKLEDLLINDRSKTQPQKKEFLLKTFELILNDLIDNNVHFMLPKFNKMQGVLYMDVIPEEKFKQIYKKGGLRKIDWLVTNFTAYFPKFRLEGLQYVKDYPVYVGGTLEDKLITLTNSGKTY